MAPRLRIVAINDVYSLENLPRLRSLVLHHARHDPAERLLVTMAGDFLAPSLLSSLDAGRGMVDCLDAVPVTHLVLGNHEDDLELEELRARLSELHGTVLMTNVSGFPDPYPKSVVLSVGEVRVGLVGVVDGEPTLYRRPPFGGATLEPANASALVEAERLRARGVSCVVALTHQRIPDDVALARSGAFCVVLGGHEHDSFLEQVAGTWVVKAPAEAVKAAIVDVTLGATPSVRVTFDDVAHYPEDAGLRAKVDAHLSRVRELEAATLLLLEDGEVLSSIGTRVRQTTLGTMICSRLRDAFLAEGCLFNGGGIRGKREYRERFTFGDLKTEVPFDNEVVVARLPGRVLREAIAASRARAPAESGGFLQVDDRMEVDDRHRLVRLDGAPLDDARVYRIALVRSLFLGMDQVEPLMRFASESPDLVPLETSGREVKLALVSAFSKILWSQLGGFGAIDTDRDGKVTVDELIAAIARATEEPPSAIAARIVLDALDRNNDRAIEADEAPPSGR